MQRFPSTFARKPKFPRGNPIPTENKTTPNLVRSMLIFRISDLTKIWIEYHKIKIEIIREFHHPPTKRVKNFTRERVHSEETIQTKSNPRAALKLHPHFLTNQSK